MKKIIYLLFLFLFIFMCYLIYELTDNDNLTCLVIGDSIADNIYLRENRKINNYNNQFINKDHRMIDLLHIIKYNEEINYQNKTISIHQLLKQSDIVIISIGMNDIYAKLEDDPKNMYTYLNEMVNNMELILDEISRYKNTKIIVLGYYNIFDKKNDLFIYINYKIKRITEKHDYIYIDTNKNLNNNQKYLLKNNQFYLNDHGYQEINELIVEKLEKTWYNIKRIYYYDLY